MLELAQIYNQSLPEPHKKSYKIYPQIHTFYYQQEIYYTGDFQEDYNSIGTVKGVISGKWKKRELGFVIK